MRKIVLFALLLCVATPAMAQRPTLDAVRARGSIGCAVSNGLPGFSQVDAQGVMRGLDADTCRALAAAVLGDASRVTFVPTTVPQAVESLRARQVDVASRNLTQTMSRDVELNLAAAGVNFYDGQGFLVRRDSGVTSLAALAGKRICVPGESSNEVSLNDLLRRERLVATPVPVANLTAMREAYVGGRCDVVSADSSGLLSLRSGLPDAMAHELLPDTISREPLGPLVRDGDPNWRRVVFYVVNAMIEAEALGITSANADAMRSSPSEKIRRFLGTLPGLGAPLGLRDDWALQVLRQVGNYGEVFDRNLGAQSPLRLERGLNDLYSRGGLLYPVPMR